MGRQAMDRFVSEQNIKRFHDAREKGADANRRPMLLRLLAEEYEKLGLSGQLRDRIERHIAKLRPLIVLQAKLIDDLTTLRQPLDQAKLVLESLDDLLACYISLRERIGAALE